MKFQLAARLHKKGVSRYLPASRTFLFVYQHQNNKLCET